MPLFPQLGRQSTEQLVTDVFGGYDRRLRIPDGEFFDTENLTTDFAPMLASRGARALTPRTACALGEKKAPVYVGADGTLYFNWLPTPLTGLSVGPKQMVSLGAYLCLFPDKKYINTEDLSDCGDMEAHFAPQSASYQTVRRDGTAVAASYVQAAEPPEPQDGQYWIDTSGPERVLRQYAAAKGEWLSVETVCVRIGFSSMGTVPRLFRVFDGVTLSGSSVSALNGDKVIYALGGSETEADWIMVAGLPDALPDAPDTALRVDRGVPELDYVCQSQNRLWGCRYGLSGGVPVNEICCCALGDFRNWRQYQGLSTDSWAGSVGSDGPWTGAVNYLGSPLFFKENRIHRVTVSPEGAHRVDETVCRGVQRGSAKSLAVVNETLYYKSVDDVCAYQGGFPVSISAALGEERYHAAAAGAVNGKYYVSMLDSGGAPGLFVYDIARGIWLREDAARAVDFACADGELYALLAQTGQTGTICALLGTLPVSGSARESAVSWRAVSGIQYYEQPENKRLSRYNIRAKMARGASLSVYLLYDGDGGAAFDARRWTLAGTVRAEEDGIAHYVLPVRPHRCDHLQLALTGSGEVRIYSIAKILELGSDYR